jgi:hypothetical protein
MEDQDSATRARLLAAVMAAQDAFSAAAQSAGATGLATEFAQRAEYLERIACQMRGVPVPVGLASDALWRVPDLGAGPPSTADHPRILFDKCLRVLDATTLEFCRGYGPKVALVLSSAMQVAYPINTTSHRSVGGPVMGPESEFGGPEGMI